MVEDSHVKMSPVSSKDVIILDVSEYEILKEKAEKIEAVKDHMQSAPDRVPRDNWLRPTKSFLLQVLDWIIAHRKILEAEE